MARPTTKNELLQVATEQFSLLQTVITDYSPEIQTKIFAFPSDFLAKHSEAHWQRDHNLRDILIHLYEWHQLLLEFINNNQQGEQQPFLPVPYNWRTYGQLNIDFVNKHQTTTLEEATTLLEHSHQEIMQLLTHFSDDELFTKKYFPWAGNAALGSYFTSATSSHYQWAIKKIKLIYKHSFFEN